MRPERRRREWLRRLEQLLGGMGATEEIDSSLSVPIMADLTASLP